LVFSNAAASAESRPVMSKHCASNFGFWLSGMSIWFVDPVSGPRRSDAPLPVLAGGRFVMYDARSFSLSCAFPRMVSGICTLSWDARNEEDDLAKMAQTLPASLLVCALMAAAASALEMFVSLNAQVGRESECTYTLRVSEM
jgi:hypothetical protein